MRARSCWRGTLVLAIEPAFRALCPIWPAWLHASHRALRRHITRLFGGSGTAAGSVHGGVVGLQHLPRSDRWANATHRVVVGRTNWRRDRTGVPDHGIGGRHGRDANVLSRDLPGSIRKLPRTERF